MTENITETAYETLKKQKELFFDKNYLKSKPFNDIIYDIFKPFTPKYLSSILMFQFAAEVALFIRYSPEIYENYTRQDKNNLKTFLKNMRLITRHLNKANNALYNISELVKNNGNNKN